METGNNEDLGRVTSLHLEKRTDGRIGTSNTGMRIGNSMGIEIDHMINVMIKVSSMGIEINGMMKIRIEVMILETASLRIEIRIMGTEINDMEIEIDILRAGTGNMETETDDPTIEISGLRVGIGIEISIMGIKTRGQMAQIKLRTEIDATVIEIVGLGTEMKVEIRGLEIEIEGLETEMRIEINVEIEVLRTEMKVVKIKGQGIEVEVLGKEMKIVKINGQGIEIEVLETEVRIEIENWETEDSLTIKATVMNGTGVEINMGIKRGQNGIQRMRIGNPLKMIILERYHPTISLWIMTHPQTQFPQRVQLGFPLRRHLRLPLIRGLL